MPGGSNDKNAWRHATSAHSTQAFSSRLRNQSWAKLVPNLGTKDVYGKALPAENTTELKIEASSLDLLPLKEKAKTKEHLNDECLGKKAVEPKQLPAPVFCANTIAKRTLNRCADKCLRKTKILRVLQQGAQLKYSESNGHSGKSYHKSTALHRSQFENVVFTPEYICNNGSPSLPPLVLNIAKIPSDFQPLDLRPRPVKKAVSQAENLKWREMLSRGSFKPLESRDLPTSGEVMLMKSRTWEKFEPSSSVIRYAKYLGIVPASTANGCHTIQAKDSKSSTVYELNKNSQSTSNFQDSLIKGDLIQLNLKSRSDPVYSLPFLHTNISQKNHPTMRCITDRGFVITPCCPPASSVRTFSPSRPDVLGQLPGSTEGDSEVDEGIEPPSPVPSTPSIDEHVLKL